MTPRDPRFDPEEIAPTADEQRLRIRWRDGAEHEYVPREVRLLCPCAGCVDEMTGQPILDPRTVPFDVFPVAIRWVGRYALGFEWSDGHDTGIYTFERLRELCPCDECSARRAPG